MLNLYDAPHSTCSQKVRLCLAEKKLPFEEIKLDLGAGKDHLKPDYLKLNPNGVVPTLVDDGRPIIDFERHLRIPGRTLSGGPPHAGRSRGTRAHARLDALSGRGPDVRGAGAILQHGVPAALRRPRPRPLPCRAGGYPPLRKHFYRRMGPAGFKKEDVEASLEQLSNTWARMDKALADGPWLLGARYSLADIVVAR